MTFGAREIVSHHIRAALLEIEAAGVPSHLALGEAFAELYTVTVATCGEATAVQMMQGMAEIVTDIRNNPPATGWHKEGRA